MANLDAPAGGSAEGGSSQPSPPRPQGLTVSTSRPLSVILPPGTLVPPSTAAAYTPNDEPERSPSIRSRLLNIADSETAAAKHLAQLDADYAQRQVILSQSVVIKYLEIVESLRAAVRAFNDRLADSPGHPLPRVSWYETANISLRDAISGDGMRVRVQRINSTFDLVLKMVHRAGREDLPIIEGYGSIGREQIRTETLMRIEGFVEKGKPKYRYSQDFKRLEIPLEEIGDRIVMAVASHDCALLSRTFHAPLIPAKRDEGSESNDADMPAVSSAASRPLTLATAAAPSSPSAS
jgi:hypothetical protein